MSISEGAKKDISDLVNAYENQKTKLDNDLSNKKKVVFFLETLYEKYKDLTEGQEINYEDIKKGIGILAMDYGKQEQTYKFSEGSLEISLVERLGWVKETEKKQLDNEFNMRDSDYLHTFKITEEGKSVLKGYLERIEKRMPEYLTEMQE